MDSEDGFHSLIDDLEKNWGLRQGEMEISGTNPSILTYDSTITINRLLPLTTSASSTADAQANDNDSVDPTTYENGDILHQMLDKTGGSNNTLTPVHTDLLESRKDAIEFGAMMNSMFQMAEEANVRELHDDDAQYRVSRLVEILYYAENIQAGILHLQNPSQLGPIVSETSSGNTPD